MQYPGIFHHGAVAGVTGSCHELHVVADASYLIVCGLFQGADTSSTGQAGRDALHIDFPLDNVRAMIATHVHIDHVGRIPCLLAAGFEGPILCSEPSAKLLPVVLEDALKLGFSRNHMEVERYVVVVQQRIIALSYNHWFTLRDTAELVCRVRLQRAVHILGSAYVEFDLAHSETGEKKRVVFSGGLGAPHAPLLPAPMAPYGADILFIESTYGDRQHENRRIWRQRLERVIDQVLEDSCTVLIPAFSIGRRTQELLYELEGIIHRVRTRSAEEGGGGRDGGAKAFDFEVNRPELTIILELPLASRFTAVYRELQSFWNQEAFKRVKFCGSPLGFEQLIEVASHSDHICMVQHLSRTARPAIVIADNGTCLSGRIVSYLKGDSRHNVLFAGHQAAGAPGQALQTLAKGGYVVLEGGRLDLRAGVATIGGYSAHADQNGLIKFVCGMGKPPPNVRIVHDEPKAKRALAARLTAFFTKPGNKPCTSPSGSKALG